ncbi:hypothetical protein NQ272_27780, partial [Escherichia coli]|nr:hypothetical protein [Escherichia coli]
SVAGAGIALLLTARSFGVCASSLSGPEARASISGTAAKEKRRDCDLRTMVMCGWWFDCVIIDCQDSDHLACERAWASRNIR